jgi:hypothetical protein
MNLPKIKRPKFIAKILVLAILVNSFAFLVNPQVAKATLASSARDSVNRLKISTAAGHDIGWTMGAQTLAAGESIVIDFNEDASGFVVAGSSMTTSDFDVTTVKSSVVTEATIHNVQVGSPDCSGSSGANDIAIGVNDTTGVVTFTTCSSWTTTDSASAIDIEIGNTATNGATGTNRITNPSSAGSTEINVTSNGGDDAFAIDIPIMDDDQVSITASVDTNITFDIDVADGTAADSNTPYTIALGELTSSAATNEGTSGVSEIYLQLATNADNGAVIQVKGATGTLASASTSDSIASANDNDGLDTGSANGNWGLAAIQDSAPTEGTLTPVSPFNVQATSNAVGLVTTSFQTIFNTGSAAISSVYGEVDVRAIAGTTTSAAADYTETLTFIATATY